jgi:FAD/FMN-containing dehydrogenase
MVDGQLLDLAAQINPNHLKSIFPKPYPAIVLLVEFDDAERQQKKLVKQAKKIFDKLATSTQIETTLDGQSRLWKIRHASATLASHAEGRARALPIIEDGVVPLDKFGEYLQGVYELFQRAKLHAAVWGHAGDANLHMQPYLDLAEIGDRQKAFRLIDEYYRLVISLGGSTSGEHGDGRLRAPYLKALYGEELYNLMAKVKQIYDPYNTLNPGVKIGVTIEDIKPLVRSEYTLDHLYDHLPHS